MSKIYTDEYKQQRDENRNRWLCGNQEAIQFVQLMINVAELWDDLVDKDREIPLSEINDVFMGLLFVLPTNEFFRKHQERLLPVMLMAVNAFYDSESLKKSENIRIRKIAFQLRFALIEVFKTCALIIGGWEHLRNVSQEMIEFYAYEDFEEWDVENGCRNSN